MTREERKKIIEASTSRIDALVAQGYVLHHAAWATGYVAPRGSCRIAPYKGRFGEGYKVMWSEHISNHFCRVAYYVKQ